MDKDILKAIEIINKVLGLIADNVCFVGGKEYGLNLENDIDSKRQDLQKIINDNKDNEKS